MGWMNPQALSQEESKVKSIIALDFDGTVVENEYPNIGKSLPGAVDTMKELTKLGYRIILLTMRHGTALDDAVRYCNNAGIDLWAINENPEQKNWSESPKVFAHLYIDDHGVGIPLLMGTNNKPCVDWNKLRDIFVSWEILKEKENPNPGEQVFDIK